MKRRFSPIFTAFAILIAMVLTVAVQSNYGQEVVNVQDPLPATAKVNNETAKIEKVVRDYLLSNPEVIRDAMQALAAREEKENTERSANLLKTLRNEIFLDPDTPVSGNSSGDVSVVVFFDYNCGYCKSTLPQLQDLVRNDPNVKVIFKELPILGPSSFRAAKAALAAGRQGKYVQFHDELLVAESTNDEVVGGIAKKLGLDLARFLKDMADPKFDAELERNSLLAGSLGINGTPAYIVGDQIIPGAIDEASLTRLVAAQRSKTATTTVIAASGEK